MTPSDDPRNQKGNNSTAVVGIIVRNGKVLCGDREYKKGNPLWTIPGGRCSSEETIEEVLRREILEEIGVSDVQIHEYLGAIAGAKEGDTLHLYRCTTAQEPRLMEPEKFNEWRWFLSEEIPGNFISSQMREFLVTYMRSRE